tara:strand:- start:518 stop:1108 length:591 start_codon:yes stop_codon:yes gene_type:complete
MKFVKDNILFIAIVLLVLWLYFFVKPTYIKTPIDLSKYKKVLTIHDTIYSKAYINRYRKGDSIPYKVIDTLYTHISDTIRIVADYNQVKAYSDTIRKDSNIFVIDDTISQNRIIARGFKAELTQKTIILREFYASKPTNTLYWGIRGSYSPLNGLEVLSPSLMLSVRNKALIGLSVDISKNYNIGYSGSIYFKIGK